MNIIRKQEFTTDLKSISAKDNILYLSVSFNQSDKSIAQKTLSDTVIDGDKISIALTAEETEKFSAGKALMQTRVVLDKATLTSAETIIVE